ncbi:transcriptional regulator ATRX-like [Sinocyclocheilus grahami]|uniref:transcriptional regulator ATRX-like n=1 Tax=Sinocyclocheilus grahami TaxID=75366 RepID=UPI0007ACFAB6|nr:PREDICTED: transcriptional regulator ATRX-like [Sinocyclocheilus grahami]
MYDELSHSECEEMGSQSPTHNEEFQSPLRTPDKSTTANNDVSPTTEEHLRGTPRGRRQIRRLLEVDQLAQETQSALKEEEERRRRLAERENLRLEIERREREDADPEVMNFMVSYSVLICKY